jgi:hypothetical protein
MASQTTVLVLTEPVLLTTSAVTEYTSPVNTTTLIKKCTVVNTSGSPASVTIYKIQAAGTAGALNTITPAIMIAAGKPYEAFEIENHVLAPGDFVQALSGTGAALSFSMSGIQIV